MSGELKETGTMGQGQSPAPVKVKEKKELSMEDYFRGGLFILVGLLLAISVLQFIGSVDQVIYTWFESEYIPVIRAVFNFAVVVFCLYVLKFHLMKKKA
ncbi:hypothetical protein [uncultured Methanomethylovorans sp.]|uniref:hypothetical protein n=1 Tax=uncultured Methanomethylovorans sp. TaxID=183759 RepID=UPI002AA8FA4D|nr:hypothetical protein [uncultured Methanomethylovorans sp.]